jgi:hypothetical protein
MRIILVLGGLLLAAGFVSSTPAQAAVSIGCACVRLGTPAATCTATVLECNATVGGVCLSACDYVPPRRMGRHHKKKM